MARLRLLRKLAPRLKLRLLGTARTGSTSTPCRQGRLQQTIMVLAGLSASTPDTADRSASSGQLPDLVPCLQLWHCQNRLYVNCCPVGKIGWTKHSLCLLATFAGDQASTQRQFNGRCQAPAAGAAEAGPLLKAAALLSTAPAGSALMSNLQHLVQPHARTGNRAQMTNQSKKPYQCKTVKDWRLTCTSCWVSSPPNFLSSRMSWAELGRRFKVATWRDHSALLSATTLFRPPTHSWRTLPAHQ